MEEKEPTKEVYPETEITHHHLFLEGFKAKVRSR